MRGSSHKPRNRPISQAIVPSHQWLSTGDLCRWCRLGRHTSRGRSDRLGIPRGVPGLVIAGMLYTNRGNQQVKDNAAETAAGVVPNVTISGQSYMRVGSR